MDRLAAEIAEYLLFRKEAALPGQGIAGDPVFMKDFAASAKKTPEGDSLKEFDLKTRLMKYRCSYMIYSRQWVDMPAALKERCWSRLQVLLGSYGPGAADWLPAEERSAIRRILAATLPESRKFVAGN